MSKKIKSTATQYDWLTFAFSFLCLAKIGCMELVDQKYRKHEINAKSKYGLNTEYNQKTLLISIIFNVKHSLEVFIKALDVATGGNYETDHNIDTLFEKAKNKINNKLKGKGFKKVVQKAFEELKLIIKKYFNCEMIKDSLKNISFPIRDTKNTLFRYPEVEIPVKINLNFMDIFKNFDNKKIIMFQKNDKSLEADIEEIKKNFLAISSVIMLDTR